MWLDQLIEQLHQLKDNLETGGKTEIYVAEYAFSMNAAQIYIRPLEQTDINFEQNVQKKLVFADERIQEGIIIGFTPIEIKNEEVKTEVETA